jgi:hypothetical protein
MDGIFRGQTAIPLSELAVKWKAQISALDLTIDNCESLADARNKAHKILQGIKK